MVNRIVERAAVCVYQVFNDDCSVHFRFVFRLSEDDFSNYRIPKDNFSCEHWHLTKILGQLQSEGSAKPGNRANLVVTFVVSLKCKKGK